MSRLLSLAILLLPATATAAGPAVTAVAYSPGGDFVAFATPGEVRLFHVDGKPAEKPTQVKGRITALAFHPHEKRLAIAFGDAGQSGVVRIHPFGSSDSPQIEIAAHKDAIYALAFSPDGRTLATAGYDRVIHLWDTDGKAAKREPRLTLKDHSDAVYGLAFHPDGKLLASASADRAVKVWDATTGKRLYTLSDPTDWVYAVAWSPDRKHLAAAGVDRSLRVWAADADGGKLVNTAFAHERPVWRLAYTSDGKTLFSAGEDRVVKSWDAAKLTELKVFDAQPDAVLDFALRPDGKQFALARFDGVGILVGTASGKVEAQPLPAGPKGEAKERPVLAQPKPMPPKVDKLTPGGGTRGKATRVIVSGTNLDQVKAVTASLPNVQVKLVAEKRTAKEFALDVSIGEAVPAGVVQLTFEGDGGKSAPVMFAVDRFDAVQEVGTTDSARSAMLVKLPVTVVGSIDRAGDVDYFRFTANAGEQIGAQVVAGELGSKLEPALALTDEGGNVLAEGTASLGFVVRKPGTYAISVRDRDFRGGADFFYRLHVGSVPVITGVFPLAVQRGRATSVHVTGVNLAPGTSGITAKVTVPADATPGSKVPVPLGELQAVGSPTVMVSEFPSVVMDPVTGADVRVPGSADGIFTKPHQAQAARFQAKKGSRLVVEVLAQRAGSPVDSVIELLDAAGDPVPFATLRCTAKTSVTFRDHDSRSPGIRLDAWNELAIDDYLYVNGEVVRILALPRGPDDDCQFYQVAGQRLAHFGTSPIHHSFGEPMYKVERHPPGRKFPPNGMPVFAVNYRNDDGGPNYGKDSALFFDPPADGTYQVRVTDARGSFGPTHNFRITVRPPKPDFTVTASVSGQNLLRGGSVPVSVTVTRFDGFAGPVAVHLKSLPEGFTAPDTSVEAGQQTATFAIFGSPDAVLPEKSKAVLVATATIGGKELVREVPLNMPTNLVPGDIKTTLRQQTITIEPGKEARFTVDIERQGKFTGRVPIEVKNLPHGVRVLHVGLNGILVTEREKSREVVLYAEPWVKPMTRPIVVIAKREGVNLEHGAKPLVLEVKK
jgi:hypothetical protein